MSGYHPLYSVGNLVYIMSIPFLIGVAAIYLTFKGIVAGYGYLKTSLFGVPTANENVPIEERQRAQILDANKPSL